MVYLSAALKSVFSLAALFLLTKIIGRRQVSQLSLFDYVNGISFGSIAAEIAISKNSEDALVGFVAMVVYTAVAIAFDLASNRSIKLRRFLEGVPLVLVENGKIYERNFSRAKIDLNEFLMSCRKEGFFDLADVHTAIFEPNGMISILPKSAALPAELRHIGVSQPDAGVPAVAVIDGKIMAKNLRNIGYDERRIKNALKEKNIDISDVFYASCTCDGTVEIFEKTKTIPKDKLE